MAISQAICSSFKKELLEGKHNFTASSGNTFKLAMFTSSASLGAATTAYASSGINETSGTNYPAGGGTLAPVTPSLVGTTGITNFATLTFSNATVTANGAMIYNDSSSDRAVLILAFGADKTSTQGDFSINFPTADASNAIIRIA